MIRKYANPIKVYKNLQENIEDLLMYSKYKKIIFELQEAGKLEAIGFSVDSNGNLYLGINLNPELLLYSETSQESVELKMISEKMKKYTEFLTKEGILDSIKMDYDRAQDDTFYGYILQISYNFKKYKRNSLIYCLSYFGTLLAVLITLVSIFA